MRKPGGNLKDLASRAGERRPAETEVGDEQELSADGHDRNEQRGHGRVPVL